MDYTIETIKRLPEEDLLIRCGQITQGSKPYEVAECFTNYLSRAIPESMIRERTDYTNDAAQVMSITMPNARNYWVVIITNDNIKKHGRNCITAFQMETAVDFSDVDKCKYKIHGNQDKDKPFHVAYEELCIFNPYLRYQYSHPLSIEALVGQMMIHK